MIKNTNTLLTFKAIYSNISGEEKYEENVISIGNVVGMILQIKEQYELLKHEFILTDDDKVNIEGRIQDMMNSEPFVIKNIKEEIFIIFDHIKKGQHFNDYMVKNERNTVYFISALDNQIEKYSISIPKDNSNPNKYPLAIFIPSGRYPDPHTYLYNAYGLHIITLDITCRGVTTGSYIGEASFMEIFQIILKKYNVDMDRIYLAGYSNAAYATWALAQAYPDLFSAIIPVSGAPYKKNIKNLMNVNVMSICGDKDDLLLTGNILPSRILAEYSRYIGLIIREAAHDSVYFHSLGKYILTWLLQHKKTHYPEKIYYRTERLRHNKAYWIKILGIDETIKYAEVNGEIINNSNICLELIGVSKFILIIPDYIVKDTLIVEINKINVFTINGITNIRQLCFKKSGNSYELLKNIEEIVPQKNCIGMGILEIYMDSLKIVIPAECDSNENIILNKIAQHFAKPSTQGWDPKVYVDYPIITDDIQTINDHKNYNLIILGCKNNNKLIKKIEDKLPIKFNDTGYEYKDVITNGDYCFFLICPNPICGNKKILLIYANSYKILKKCIISRKIILPSYSNGLHPLLNCEAIIFNGNSYFTIDILGNDIVKI